MRHRLVTPRALALAGMLTGCAGASSSRQNTASPAPLAPRGVAASGASLTAAACAAPEHRQLDFWLGDWDVLIRARTSPTSNEWGDGKGHQRVESILGGCVIAEDFRADGPGGPWAGRSYSMWQPKLGTWRQTWVDDSGSFIALTGGLENGTFTLYGEPRTVEGKQIQMRMLFDVQSPDRIHWEWQRTDDAWATSTLMMAIDYARRR